MHYLITGGTGMIGRHWVESLNDHRDSVIILSRTPHRDQGCCRYIQNLSVLPADTQIDVVINLAGSPVDCRWTAAAKNRIIQSRVQITKDLIACLKRLTVKPRVMISASAIGYYGVGHHTPVDESSEALDAFTHDVCDVWEQVAQQATTLGIRLCIARLGVVLSSRGGYIKKIRWPFKMGLGGRLGEGTQSFSWVHVADVVAVMRRMINDAHMSGVYNLVAPHVVCNGVLTARIAAAVRRPAICHLPGWLVRCLFGEMGEQLLLKGDEIVPARLMAAGYHFQYPAIDAALQDVLCSEHG